MLVINHLAFKKLVYSRSWSTGRLQGCRGRHGQAWYGPEAYHGSEASRGQACRGQEYFA